MVTRYFIVAVALFVCSLPTTAWNIAVAQERAEEPSPWSNHGDQLEVEANSSDNVSKVPGSLLSSGHRASVRPMDTVRVIIAATATLFLVFRWSSQRKQKAVPQQALESELAAPQSDADFVEPYGAEDVELRSGPGGTDGVDIVALQIGILTLNVDDASTLSPAERRMVTMALDNLQAVGDELEVLHANAEEVDRQIADVQEEIEQVKVNQGAHADYRENVLEGLQTALEKLEEQSNRAWELYEEKDGQRDQMGYSEAQEHRSARILSSSAARRDRDGAPPLTPKAAAAVAAAEKVLQTVRLHSPLPVFSGPPSLFQQAGKVEKAVKVHALALAQALQRWNEDRSALVAAAEETLGEANAVLGQLEAGGMDEASSSLKASIESLRGLIVTASKSNPSTWMTSMSSAAETIATAGAVARVREQNNQALRISRDLGKMLRDMDGTEGQYRRMEALFGEGVTIFTIAMHTKVPEEVPYEVYLPFQLALRMCEKVLADVASSLQPRWRAEMDKQKGKLLNAAGALRQTRMQATAHGVSGVYELLESDMRRCRAALNEAKALYKSLMAYGAFRPALPFIANGCVLVKLAMDGAQTELVQAADLLASAWEAELEESIEALKLQADEEDVQQLSSRADEGGEALARIYHLAEPSPQFEGLEDALKRARLLVEALKQQQQQDLEKEKQESTKETGAASRLTKWLKQKISGKE
ncbi:hypothetical protein, conserved [Eimeria praecox]|uniref:Uncharacterized protein n=1 Tax=Eimeria praecox TaxID=51316 RepID=U6H4G7_9EIME|nr:hypothetical protein, conserved [Eimeria praecox]